MKTVLISGGSGMVGSRLAEVLGRSGYEVRILSRQKKQGFYHWDPVKREIDPTAFQDLDVIVHLAGATIAKRWTADYKRELYTSRVDTSGLLLEYVQKTQTRLKCFVSASGVNYYGSRTSKQIYTEDDPHSDDFLGQLCADWESAASDFKSCADRVCVLRTAVVLSERGGMIRKLIPPARLGLISPLGSGNQIVPWIHLDDLAEIYRWLIEHSELSGAYNAAATQIVNSREFTEAFMKAAGKRILLPNVPGFMLRLMFGETAEIMTEGSAVSNKKIKDSGFRFRFDHLDSAMKDISVRAGLSKN